MNPPPIKPFVMLGYAFIVKLTTNSEFAKLDVVTYLEPKVKSWAYLLE